MKYHHATETERLSGGIEEEIRRGKRLVRWFWWLLVLGITGVCLVVVTLIEVIRRIN